MPRRIPLGRLLVVLLLATKSGWSEPAVITGKIVLPAAEVTATAPQRYSTHQGEAAPPDLPVAVVYLEGTFPSEATNTPPGTAAMWQRGMQFRPALLPVRVGTAVAFPNDDDFYHNVFSYSKPKRFDLGRYRREDEPVMQVFDKPGVVKLYCEIHPNMRGVIVVLDSPFFATTDTNGFYQLTNLPAGNYTLKTWADEKHNSEKPVELHSGQTLHVDFNLKNPEH
jgi:plastocyanin